MKVLSKEQKVGVISNCDEVMLAVKILICLMDDADIRNRITLEYELNGDNYKLEFTKMLKARNGG